MITIQLTSASKVGCVRSQNEDMILVGSHFVRNDGFDTRIDLTNSDRYIIAAMWPAAMPCTICNSSSTICLRA